MAFGSRDGDIFRIDFVGPSDSDSTDSVSDCARWPSEEEADAVGIDSLSDHDRDLATAGPKQAIVLDQLVPPKVSSAYAGGRILLHFLL